MARLARGPGFLAIALLAALPFVAACLPGEIVLGDPGTDLTLQIVNRTDRTIRLTIPVVIGMYQAPPQERPEVDVSVRPGETKEVKMGWGLGSWAGPVRAYADERLIFCQEYDYPTGPRRGGYYATYRVEIVEGHIAPGCADAGPPPATAQPTNFPLWPTRRGTRTP